MQKIKHPAQFSIILLALLVIVGSCSNCSKTSTSATIIGDWARNGEIDPTARTQASTFQIGDSVYICCGYAYNGTSRLNDLWVFNASGNTWLKRTSFPGTPRSNATAFAVGGKGYVGIGFDGVNMLQDFWQFNPATNSWSQVANFGGTARYGAAGFGLDTTTHFGYVCCGFDGNYNRDLWQYNPANNTWTQKSSLGGSKRQNPVVFVYKQQAYLVTGQNNGSYPNDFWTYNGTTDAWTVLRPIGTVDTNPYDALYGSNIERSDASAFIMNNKAYVVFGIRSGALLNTCWEYTFDNTNGGSPDTWIQKTAFEGTARMDAIGFSVKNQGYVATGGNQNGTVVSDDIWTFFPNNVVNPLNNQ